MNVDTNNFLYEYLAIFSKQAIKHFQNGNFVACTPDRQFKGMQIITGTTDEKVCQVLRRHIQANLNNAEAREERLRSSYTDPEDLGRAIDDVISMENMFVNSSFWTKI